MPRILEIAAGADNAPHWQESAYRNAIDPELVPPRLALVATARETGAAVGFAVASLLAGEAELESIVIAAEWQRRGIGRLLLAELMDRLRRQNTRAVFLEVRASNHAALHLYRSFGFAETGRRARYYACPLEDGVTMRLPLD
ncbi:MAG: ribosomal protein S18-alanine N-acetyltransferase [Acidobacteriota bacterium]